MFDPLNHSLILLANVGEAADSVARFSGRFSAQFSVLLLVFVGCTNVTAPIVPAVSDSAAAIGFEYELKFATGELPAKGELSFPPIIADGAYSRELRLGIRNGTGQPVSVAKIDLSCGCVSVTPNELTLGPDESRPLLLSLKPAKPSERSETRHIRLTLRTAEAGVHQLDLSFVVVPRLQFQGSGIILDGAGSPQSSVPIQIAADSPKDTIELALAVMGAHDRGSISAAREVRVNLPVETRQELDARCWLHACSLPPAVIREAYGSVGPPAGLLVRTPDKMSTGNSLVIPLAQASPRQRQIVSSPRRVELLRTECQPAKTSGEDIHVRLQSTVGEIVEVTRVQPDRPDLIAAVQHPGDDAGVLVRVASAGNLAVSHQSRDTNYVRGVIEIAGRRRGEHGFADFKTEIEYCVVVLTCAGHPAECPANAVSVDGHSQ